MILLYKHTRTLPLTAHGQPPSSMGQLAASGGLQAAPFWHDIAMASRQQVPAGGSDRLLTHDLSAAVLPCRWRQRATRPARFGKSVYLEYSVLAVVLALLTDLSLQSGRMCALGRSGAELRRRPDSGAGRRQGGAGQWPGHSSCCQPGWQKLYDSRRWRTGPYTQASCGMAQCRH